MASPVDTARINTNVSAAAATWNVNVGSPVAGTLLIVFVRAAADPGAVTFTGYTPLVNGDTSDATDDSTFVYYRWADGNEGASDVWDPTNSIKGCAICWEITNAVDPAIAPPTVSSVNVGTTSANTATGNSVAPSSAPQDTLYLTMAAGGGEVGAYTAAPASYANLIAANSGTGSTAATNVIAGGASRRIAQSNSDDPGVFTHGAHTGGWTAYTVAIRGGTGAVVYPVTATFTTAGLRTLRGIATQALAAALTTQGTRALRGAATQALTASFTTAGTAETPTLTTSVARISLAPGSFPKNFSDHAINVRARVTSGSGALFAALYEGANNRSGDLQQALTTSLADYSLAIAEADAADITSYADLELRIWGEAAGSVTFEVDQASLAIPEAALAGAATQALTFSSTTSGRLGAKGAATQALTLTRTTQAKVAAKGSATQALTATLTTQGTRTLRARTDMALAFASTTVAKIAAKGAATQALTATLVTQGVRARRGSSDLALSTTLTTQGTVQAGAETFFGETTSAYTLASTTSGRVTRKGAATQALTTTLTTVGKVTAKGRTSGGITNLLSNGGFESGVANWTLVGATLDVDQPGYFGANHANVQTNDSAGAEGIYATFVVANAGVHTVSVYITDTHAAHVVRLAVRDNAGGNAQLGTPFALTAAWQRYTFTTTSLSPGTWRFYIETTTQQNADFDVDGAQVQSGSVATPYIETNGAPSTRFTALDITTGPAHVTRKGATTSAYTLTLTTTGARTVYGKVGADYGTGDYGTGKYSGSPFALTLTTVGHLTPAHGVLSFALALDITSQGATMGQETGAVVLPLTLTSTTSGYVTAKAQTTQALTLGQTTVGKVHAHGAIVLPLTLSLAADGTVAGKQYGTVVLPLTLATTTSGTVTRHAQIVLPLALTRTTVGKVSAKSSIVVPLTLVITTSGTGAAGGVTTSAYTLTLTTAGSRLIRGRSAVTLSSDFTTAGYKTTQGVVSLPLTVAYTSAGYALKFASAQELALALAIVTKGTRQGSTLILLEPILAGHIDRGERAHIDRSEQGVIAR